MGITRQIKHYELLEFMAMCEMWKKAFYESPKQTRERSLIMINLDQARLWASEELALEEDDFDE